MTGEKGRGGAAPAKATLARQNFQVDNGVGGRDPDKSAGRVHLLFRQTHVRALLDEPGRQAHRQVRRQLQRREGERLARFLARITAEESRRAKRR